MTKQKNRYGKFLRYLSLIGLATLCLTPIGYITYMSTDTNPKNVNKTVLSSKKIVQPKKPNKKYAVIICGSSEPVFEHKTVKVYESLKNIGYEDEDIKCLMPNYKPNLEGYIDSVCNKESVLKAFEDVSRKITKDDVLFLYFGSHGTLKKGESVLGIKRKETINETELKDLISKLEYQYATFFIEACHSGGFPETLGKGNNIVISTSHKEKLSHQNSVFMEKTIEIFSKQEKKADKDKNGKISLEESIDYAAAKDGYTRVEGSIIWKFLPGRQCPQLQYQDVKPSEIYPD